MPATVEDRLRRRPTQAQPQRAQRGSCSDRPGAGSDGVLRAARDAATGRESRRDRTGAAHPAKWGPPRRPHQDSPHRPGGEHSAGRGEVPLGRFGHHQGQGGHRPAHRQPHHPRCRPRQARRNRPRHRGVPGHRSARGGAAGRRRTPDPPARVAFRRPGSPPFATSKSCVRVPSPCTALLANEDSRCDSTDALQGRRSRRSRRPYPRRR